jgi:hypothetical protein
MSSLHLLHRHPRHRHCHVRQRARVAHVEEELKEREGGELVVKQVHEVRVDVQVWVGLGLVDVEGLAAVGWLGLQLHRVPRRLEAIP